jgi:hypothetical protein
MITSASTPNDSRTPTRNRLLRRALVAIHTVISNVIDSNDCIVLGIYKDPSNAHTKYNQNKPVANAIAHGSGTLANANGVFCAK